MVLLDALGHSGMESAGISRFGFNLDPNCLIVFVLKSKFKSSSNTSSSHKATECVIKYSEINDITPSPSKDGFLLLQRIKTTKQIGMANGLFFDTLKKQKKNN